MNEIKLISCLIVAIWLAGTNTTAAAAGAEATAPDAPAAAATATPTALPETPLFAIEITVGPNWDPAQPPNAQPFFREHSANLRRLRDSGRLLIGARYADKGLIIVRAASVAEVHGMMEDDPSIPAGIFKYVVHPFAVFYPGAVEASPPG